MAEHKVKLSLALQGLEKVKQAAMGGLKSVQSGVSRFGNMVQGQLDRAKQNFQRRVERDYSRNQSREGIVNRDEEKNRKFGEQTDKLERKNAVNAGKGMAQGGQGTAGMIGAVGSGNIFSMGSVAVSNYRNKVSQAISRQQEEVRAGQRTKVSGGLGMMGKAGLIGIVAMAVAGAGKAILGSEGQYFEQYKTVLGREGDFGRGESNFGFRARQSDRTLRIKELDLAGNFGTSERFSLEANMLRKNDISAKARDDIIEKAGRYSGAFGTSAQSFGAISDISYNIQGKSGANLLKDVMIKGVQAGQGKNMEMFLKQNISLLADLKNKGLAGDSVAREGAMDLLARLEKNKSLSSLSSGMMASATSAMNSSLGTGTAMEQFRLRSLMAGGKSYEEAYRSMQGPMTENMKKMYIKQMGVEGYNPKSFMGQVFAQKLFGQQNLALTEGFMFPGAGGRQLGGKGIAGEKFAVRVGEFATGADRRKIMQTEKVLELERYRIQKGILDMPGKNTSNAENIISKMIANEEIPRQLGENLRFTIESAQASPQVGNKMPSFNKAIRARRSRAAGSNDLVDPGNEQTMLIQSINDLILKIEEQFSDKGRNWNTIIIKDETDGTLSVEEEGTL